MRPQAGEAYLDVTAGYGGHASAVLDVTRSHATLIDRDGNAVRQLQSVFAAQGDRIRIIHDDFLHACTDLIDEGQTFDLILADVGVSSPHLDNSDRGFSVATDGPLDMRMDADQELTAETVVNTYDEAELARILKVYGEEPKATRIARMIVESRPLKTTSELATLAKRAWPGHSRVHPATRLFQAIRIEVNGELHQLEQSLPLMVRLLESGGRLGVITFHSLEDRIVKRFFKEHASNRYDAELTELTPKPIMATTDEIVHNPRARSAKMRVAQRK